MKIIIIYKKELMRVIHTLFITFLLSGSLLLARPAVAQVTDVEVFYPKISVYSQQLTLTGTVEARQHSDLAPLQAGVVADFFVEIGDRVEQGQKLLALDAKLAQLSLAQRQADVTAALANKIEADRLLREIESLSKKQLVAETLMAERQSGVAVAVAALSRAEAELAHQQEELDRHTLYAPFAGIIAERNVDVGEWVTQQTQVLTLVQKDNLRLNLSIPQEYYARLNGQQNVSVEVIPDFDNAAPITASLSRIVAVAKNNSRTLTGLVNLPTNSDLIAGMSARAIITLPNSSNQVVWLPKSAIKQHPDGGRSVFAVINDKAKRFFVQVVQQQGERVAVMGAPLDAPFVTSGVELLSDGLALNVTAEQGRAQ